MVTVTSGAIAVPLSVTGKEAAGDVSEIVRVAERAVPPDAPGVKTTETVHDPVVAGRVWPVQLLVLIEKSLRLVPVIVGAVPETVTAAFVGLLSVTVCDELATPTVCGPKVSDVGLTLTAGFAEFPFRVIVTVPAPPPVPKWTTAVPGLAPEPLGVNVM